MIDIKEVENQIARAKQDKPEDENHSLAYMLLSEVKASCKRWFIIAIVELFIIFGIIGGMIVYNLLPVESYTSTIETDGDLNTIVGIGDNHGDQSKSISEDTP